MHRLTSSSTWACETILLLNGLLLVSGEEICFEWWGWDKASHCDPLFIDWKMRPAEEGSICSEWVECGTSELSIERTDSVLLRGCSKWGFGGLVVWWASCFSRTLASDPVMVRTYEYKLMITYSKTWSLLLVFQFKDTDGTCISGTPVGGRWDLEHFVEVVMLEHWVSVWPKVAGSNIYEPLMAWSSISSIWRRCQREEVSAVGWIEPRVDFLSFGHIVVSASLYSSIPSLSGRLYAVFQLLLTCNHRLG